MDVMAAAATRSRPRAGARDPTWRSGQPAASACHRMAAARAALPLPGYLGYTETLGIPRCGAHRAALRGQVRPCARPRPRCIVTTGSSAGFILGFLALFGPATAWRSPVPAIRPTATSLRPRLRPVADPDLRRRPAGRSRPTTLIAEHRRRRSKASCDPRALPTRPDHDDCCGVARSDRCGGGRRASACLRRDLSRPRLRLRRRLRGAVVGQYVISTDG